ncbi:family 2A encapsulin nanocompartment cargo protein cysteine desulfurase [Granulicella mallensis]|uniref:Cysteine desulfurase n=1 Tax=Granulicella mallensis TaxID=940614 RepID=A0A7W8E8M8_9BACT|nr:family 2A encapsulin nanocompartment cargo protein cysteine desulfurase [Granulicella mallensis]MBB5062791.1 cysteine desulfurase/selenocysteine lyase [Granulicella mallensis]
MSTSERDQIGNAGDSPRANEMNGPSMGALPDISAIAQLANEFFRALPGQASSPLAAASAPEMPVVAPSLGTGMPQFGAPLPSLPAMPAVDKLPSEADASRLAGTSFVFPKRANSSPTTELPPMGEAGQYAPRNIATDTLVSPFSMPLPAFDTAFLSFEPLFPASSDSLVAESVPSAPPSANSFYFLESAGTQAKPVEAPPANRLPALRSEPALDLKLPRRQFEIGSVRRDFPILRERVNGKPLIWLDNAATTQKPQSVIDRLSYFYEHENSNIHRAAHELAARATDAYEDARNKVAHFLNAPSSKEIVFVRGATEAINLVAQGWGRRHIEQGDEIVITWIEHHANIVPWQMLAAEKGARLRVAPVDDDGQILLDEFEKLLGPRTKLVSLTQVSNALGTITPAHQMVQMAHRYGARVLVDGAQAVSHMPVDVQSLDCDFYVFSGHKVFAPTGIGVLYGKPDALAEMQPWQGGGNMIVDVTFEKTIYQPPPSRFEAGTGNIADAVGLGAAIDYLDQLGMANVARYEHELLVYATQGLLTVPGLRLIGTAKEKAGVLSFVLDGFRTEEVGAALNREGIAVRSGHHCAQPTLRRFGVETTVRPSLALYNNAEDIDALVAGLIRLKSLGR